MEHLCNEIFLSHKNEQSSDTEYNTRLEHIMLTLISRHRRVSDTTPLCEML